MIILHVDGNVNPIRDKETIDIELQLKIWNGWKTFRKGKPCSKTGNKEAQTKAFWIALETLLQANQLEP
jgi:ribosome-binding ATPase YchF (GTP1/OBG family)